MLFEHIASLMRRHYNSETRKLQLQSEMDSTEQAKFMRKHKIDNFADELTKLVDYINILAPQFPQRFGDGQHKAR